MKERSTAFGGAQYDIKKGFRSVGVRRAEQVTLVRQLQESNRIAVLCDACGLSYNTLKYQRLHALMKTCHRHSNGSANARTLAARVSLQGIPLSRYRASRLMKQLDLHSTQQRKHIYRKAT